jgi:hypothetical protein
MMPQKLDAYLTHHKSIAVSELPCGGRESMMPPEVGLLFASKLEILYSKRTQESLK